MCNREMLYQALCCPAHFRETLPVVRHGNMIALFVWRTRRLGWFLEPSYGVALGDGNKKSVGLTGGIFFAVP